MNWIYDMKLAPKDGSAILTASKYLPDDICAELEKIHAPMTQEVIYNVVSWRNNKWQTGRGEIWPPFAWCEIERVKNA